MKSLAFFILPLRSLLLTNSNAEQPRVTGFGLRSFEGGGATGHFLRHCQRSRERISRGLPCTHAGVRYIPCFCTPSNQFKRR